MSPRMLIVTLFFAQVNSVLTELNVYGQPMTDCGPNHGAGCTYSAMDAGAHEVCVTRLPQGFSAVTGQGPWSDEFTGQPWCICIWAYSNYILQNKDLSLKCDSIPAKVLEEQYSLEKFKQCGSMSSSAGCGPEDIRRSIQRLCTQCDQEVSDVASKSALKSKCDTILAAAPAAPMRLYAAQGGGLTNLRQRAAGFSPVTMGVCGFVIAAFAFGMVVRNFCHNVAFWYDEETGLECEE